MSHVGAEDEAWTIGRLLRWTTEYLGRHGAESPRLEAEILLAHALDWPRVRLYMHINEDVGELGRATFRELIKKRAAGEPVAYLVGHKEFYSLDFEVNRHVLIPRPDTETLVMTFLELAKAIENPLCIDVGTGSGCIPIACCKHHASARFVA
ncbi:MAG: Release factor glutamine methyltransferase, partial [Planctomycetota bacterium]